MVETALPEGLRLNPTGATYLCLRLGLAFLPGVHFLLCEMEVTVCSSWVVDFKGSLSEYVKARGGPTLLNENDIKCL